MQIALGHAKIGAEHDSLHDEGDVRTFSCPEAGKVKTLRRREHDIKNEIANTTLRERQQSLKGDGKCAWLWSYINCQRWTRALSGHWNSKTGNHKLWNVSRVEIENFQKHKACPCTTASNKKSVTCSHGTTKYSRKYYKNSE